MQDPISQQKSRIPWIDYSKALLIYLMVVGHCGASGLFSQFIYAFHIPAFFIISGYLYKPHHWLKTLKSFLIPIIFYSIINFIVYATPKLISGNLETENLGLRIFLPYFLDEMPPGIESLSLVKGMWFIIVLMFCRFIIGDIHFFYNPIKKYRVLIIAICILWILFEQISGYQNPLWKYKLYKIISCLPFVLTGTIIKDKISVEHITAKMCLVWAALFIFISFIQGKCDLYTIEYGITYPLFFINATIGSLILFKSLSHFSPKNWIKVLSIGTLFILGCHIFLRNWIMAIMSKCGINIDHNFNAILVGVIIILICYYPISLLKQYKPILLGKS